MQKVQCKRNYEWNVWITCRRGGSARCGLWGSAYLACLLLCPILMVLLLNVPLKIVAPEKPFGAVAAWKSVDIIQPLTVHYQLLVGFAGLHSGRGAVVLPEVPQVIFPSPIHFQAFATAIRGVTMVTILVCIQVILAGVRTAAFITFIRPWAIASVGAIAEHFMTF